MGFYILKALKLTSMNKKVKNLISRGVLYGALPLLVACSDENPWNTGNGEGGITPHLTTSGEVKSSIAVRSSASELDVPEASQFSLSLSKLDGTYQKTWSSFDLFPTEDKFKVGQYTMSAFYGDIEDEGFERPYFYGESTFSVAEDQSTDVEITAKLANTMVSVAYTDAFKTYFKDFSTTLHSAGGAYIVVPKEETRPAYLMPGDVSITVSLTKQNNISATFQPADFKAEAQHHYRVTFDVNNGEVGEAQLVITFDDTVEQEAVQIDLSDEMMTAPAPQVIAQGFSTDTPLEILEQSTLSDPAKFFIRAKSGITNATLTVSSSASLSLGTEFDICSLSQAQLAQLTAAGIKETGLSGNLSTLAQVDMSSFLSTLPSGTHTFTLVVKDKMTKVNDPVAMTVNVSPLTLNIISVTPAAYGSDEGAAVVAFNGTNLAEKLTIEAVDDYGTRRQCDITSITPRSSVRRTSDAYPTKQYDVKFKLPSTSRNVTFYVNYAGKEMAQGTVERRNIDFTINADPYANRAVVYVTTDETDAYATIINNLRVFAGSTELTITSRSVDRHYVIVHGLSAGSTYELKATMQSGSNPSSFCSPVSITTEAASVVPNGDFETLAQTINTTLNQGGRYSNLTQWTTVYNKETYDVYEPTGWASVNAKTCNLSSSTLNTWFVVPSTYNTSEAQSGSNAMVVRSVGYDYAGSEPGRDSRTDTGAYSRKEATVANAASGRLFLGSYTINTSTMEQTFNQGVSFASRPTSLTGYYNYATDATDTAEKGVVTVTLLNGSTEIGTGSIELSAATAFTAFTIPITYNVAYTKPTSLRIMICSTNRGSYSVTEETTNVKTTKYTELVQKAIGAVLTIDNLKFNY
jgi:hypothetical protein